jgi:NAD+ synthase (glutamine-hydrolysing)
MRIALAQLNPTVGDVAGNLRLLERALERVVPERPELVVFPELFLTGYPPLDLLERDWFIDQSEAAVERVVEVSGRLEGIGLLVGAAVRSGLAAGKGLYNAAVLAEGGRELSRHPKSLLPAYDVFDERRHFDPARQVRKARFRDTNLGITVCEDAWSGPDAEEPNAYELDPVEALARGGADIIVNIAASPFAAGRERARWRLLAGHARRFKLPVVFVNQVGGNDELVFDGRSMVVDRRGGAVRVLGSFVEELRVVETDAAAGGDYRPEEEIATVHDALVLGIRDYFAKCGFQQAVIGLSGGVDSAVVAALAVETLGAANVLGVTMPSRFSSRGSVRDSAALAANLGIELRRIPIGRLYNGYLAALRPELAGAGPDATEENIQARVRGNILMAIANRSGRLVLATGNKSEMAVGYCTLYGDMSGALAVLADVPKTMVWELAGFINRGREVIPAAIIRKPPSAELRPGQLDQDTLPPYDVLDRILSRYIEEGKPVAEIAAEGFDRAMVDWVARAVDRSEHKRRQAAPGIRVTTKAFGMGRRMPIAARFRPDRSPGR